MEAWLTNEDLRDARHKFAAAIPGWVQPVAHGLVRVDAAGRRALQTANTRDHQLPAVVLASVIGHTTGTATVPVTRGQLERAAELLAPAEAAAHWDHPNLWAWRRLLADHELWSRLEAVFIADFDDPLSGEADEILRTRLGH